MICGFGIDIVEIQRIESVWRRFGERFMLRVLHVTEIDILPQKGFIQFIASRFAVKEATVKALGTGFTNGISYKDIAVHTLHSGKPVVSLYGKALEVFSSSGTKSIHLSLSHEKKYTVASVIIEYTT